MSEVDEDLSLAKILWFIKGGKILVRRDGVDIISIRSNGVEPEVDLLNLDSLVELMPVKAPLLMERMRKLSRKMAGSDLNIKVTVNGDLFLNMGKEGSTLKDLEGFASVLMKRLNHVKFTRKRK